MKDFLHKIGVKASTVIYLLAFIYALRSALPTYINSSFLSDYTGEDIVGIIYTISAIVTMIAFAYTPKILERFGNYRTVMFALTIDLLSLVILAFIPSITFVVIAFILNFVTISIIGFNMDLFMENYSTDDSTGKIRGIYLTSINSAWVVAAIIGSFLIADGEYYKLFFMSAIVLIPLIIGINGSFSGFEDPKYKSTPFWQTLKEIYKDKDIENIFIINFLLQLFFSWMIIYTPIYLHDHIGITWQTIGIIFSIMLVPFVLVGLPLGKIADTKLGEKELLITGFLIMAISTSIISFISVKSAIVWAIILFMTRVGAAIIEIMSDTYFFKKVSGTSVELIGLYRSMRSLSMIIGPVIATVFLTMFDIKFLFVALGLIMFWGLKKSIEIKDTL